MCLTFTHHKRRRMMKTRTSVWLWSVVLLAAAAACWAADAPKLVLKAGDLVAVCGDSITEQQEYTVDIEDYLLMCQPAAALRMVQAGWSGETAPGFLARLARDVLVFHPNVVTTCYGMNDGHYGPMQPATAAVYRKAQQAIVEQLKKGGVRVVIAGSPGVVDVDAYHPERPGQATVYDKTLAGLRDIAREVAADQGCLFADVYDPMMETMLAAKKKYGAAYHLAGRDGVHPARNGQLVMAYAFLKSLGCDGQIGTISVELAGGKATATAGHRVLAAEGGSVELESTRYPFCFFGEPASPNSTRGVLEFLPFNQDLNRFCLVVADAKPAARYKVTWGTAGKEFSGADLAKGVNLAAEILDNPFTPAFLLVEQAIRGQQRFETLLTKDLLHNLAAHHPQASQAEKDGIVAELLRQDAALRAKAAAAVKPLRHTIKIEEVQ
jgi:lysophospholipase L1-like esterase